MGRASRTNDQITGLQDHGGVLVTENATTFDQQAQLSVLMGMIFVIKHRHKFGSATASPRHMPRPGPEQMPRIQSS